MQSPCGVLLKFAQNARAVHQGTGSHIKYKSLALPDCRIILFEAVDNSVRERINLLLKKNYAFLLHFLNAGNGRSFHRLAGPWPGHGAVTAGK